MEEALVLILQLLFELIVQLLLYGGIDFITMWVEKNDKPGGLGCLLMFLFAVIGVGFAALANLFHPVVFLPYDWLRIANLIVGPLLAGGVSWLFTDWRRRRGARLVPRLHFWFAFCFVFGFDVVRFIYGRH
jgi:uncharacterized membrane protein YccC